MKQNKVEIVNMRILYPKQDSNHKIDLHEFLIARKEDDEVKMSLSR